MTHDGPVGTWGGKADRSEAQPAESSPWRLLTRKPVRTRSDYQLMLIGGVLAALISAALLGVIAFYGLPPVQVPAAAPAIPGLAGLLLLVSLGGAVYAARKIPTAPVQDPSVTPAKREAATALAWLLVAMQGAVALVVGVGLLVTGRLIPGALSLVVAALSGATVLRLRRDLGGRPASAWSTRSTR